jgi:hypothetical protein
MYLHQHNFNTYGVICRTALQVKPHIPPLRGNTVCEQYFIKQNITSMIGINEYATYLINNVRLIK